jgi:hypothetical protein
VIYFAISFSLTSTKLIYALCALTCIQREETLNQSHDFRNFMQRDPPAFL